MKKTRDERYYYRAGATGRAWCHLQVYRSAAGVVVAISTETLDNPGISITNWAEHLAEAVWEQEGHPQPFVWIEHYADEGRAELPESWSVVRFKQGKDGHFRDPGWQPITSDEVAGLVAQEEPTDLPAGWQALWGPYLQLDCLQCGRPLGAGELLAGKRLCAACRDAPGRKLGAADPELASARAVWQRRYNAHEERLGLNADQRARLFQMLAGDRSLWSFTPAELDILADRLEQFQSAAEVQAFLDAASASGDDRPDDFL